MTALMKPLGYRWRSSKFFVVASISVAIFSETFLYSFLVPILFRILEDRLHVDPAHTQFYNSASLATHGLVSMIASPIIGHFADKNPHRKAPLLVSIVGCMIGTVLVAISRHPAVFFLGRIFQAAAGSAVWVIGMATITESVGEEHSGKAVGVAMSFTSGGIISGPMISSLLFEKLGYWATWTAPLILLTFDLIFRLLMIESTSGSLPPSTPSLPATIEPNLNECGEASPLLRNGYSSSSTPPKDSSEDANQHTLATSSAFYGAMLKDRRVLTALLVSVASITVVTSFDATLPLHVREVFNWGPSTTGLMFLCLEGPAMISSPFCGWLRDRFGVRCPAVLSMFVWALLLWLLGIPGNEHFPCANGMPRGPAIYITAMICMGTVSPFQAGLAVLEVTAVVKERQAENPNIFGPHGALIRASSLVDVALTFAMMVGPILSGALHASVGYYYMNLTLAAMFILLLVPSFFFLGNKRAKQAKPIREQ